MADDGAVRVNWTRRVLKELEHRDPGVHRKVLERMGGEHTRAIEAAGLLAWLPCHHHMALCDALRGELGDEGITRHFAHATLAAGRLPLFRGLAEAAIRMFGPTPASLVRAGPQAWKTIFRDLGTFESAPGPDACSTVATVMVTSPTMRRDETFAMGVEGGVWACLELTGRTGSVERDFSDYRRRGLAIFTLHWED